MPHAPLPGPSLRLRLFGVPVWFHWSFPAVGLGIGVPVGAMAFIAAGNLAFELFAWCLVAVSALALVHEAGHAAMARLLSLKVHALLFAAAGGCCIAEEAACAKHELAYSTAGLACQLVVLAATTLMLVGALPSPDGRYGAAVFTAVNLLLVAANCWPSAGSDGHRIARALDQLLARGSESAA
jgi:Zn-dependent protease